jgi:predicted metal-dependent hydrolase
LERERFFAGIHLFNDHEFFEAHEVWEDAWRAIPRPPRGTIDVRREFYQGLIQCAVALEHYKRSNPRGVLCLYETYPRHLSHVPAQYMGVDIAALLAAMHEALRPVLEADPVPERGQIALDLSRVPRIDVSGDPFAGDEFR